MRTISLHTSEAISFKRCRRLWGWTSPNRSNLQANQRALPLWFGTGWHFVMEDLYGYRLYSDVHECWEDYIRATLECYGRDGIPADASDALPLGHEMLSHYEGWLQERDPLKTLWIGNEPQVEVNFKIVLPVHPDILEALGLDVVYFEGTIDRNVIDDYSIIRIQEYKTAKQIAKMHFMYDPQVSRYLWAGTCIYEQPIMGCWYTQWRKDIPKEPEWLVSSKRFSTADNQRVTFATYKEALLKVYGDVELAPKGNQDYLTRLKNQETEHDDGYVRRDLIERSAAAIEAEGVKILLEAEDMLNPNLALYPNPTRACNMAAMRCDFLDPCIAVDNGDDFDHMLRQGFNVRSEERGRDPWRLYLKHQNPPKLKVVDQVRIPRITTPQEQSLLAGRIAQ